MDDNENNHGHRIPSHERQRREHLLSDLNVDPSSGWVVLRSSRRPSSNDGGEGDRGGGGIANDNETDRSGRRRGGSSSTSGSGGVDDDDAAAPPISSIPPTDDLALLPACRTLLDALSLSFDSSSGASSLSPSPSSSQGGKDGEEDDGKERERLASLRRDDNLFNLIIRCLEDLEGMAAIKEKYIYVEGQQNGTDEKMTRKERRRTRHDVRGANVTHRKLRQLEESRHKRLEQLRQRQQSDEREDADEDELGEDQSAGMEDDVNTTQIATNEVPSSSHQLLPSQRTQVTLNSLRAALIAIIPLVTHPHCFDGDTFMPAAVSAAPPAVAFTEEEMNALAREAHDIDEEGEVGQGGRDNGVTRDTKEGTRGGATNSNSGKSGKKDVEQKGKGRKSKKKNKNKKKCYLFGSRVYGTVGEKGMHALLRRLNDLMSRFSLGSGLSTSILDVSVVKDPRFLAPLFDARQGRVDYNIDKTLGCFFVGADGGGGDDVYGCDIHTRGTDRNSHPSAAHKPSPRQVASHVDQHILRPLSYHDPHLRQAHLASIERLRSKLLSAIRSRYRDVELTIYGSCLSGLSLGKNSDVDVSIHLSEAHRIKNAFDAGIIDAERYQKRMRDLVFGVKRAIEYSHQNARGHYDRGQLVTNSSPFVDLFAVHQARIPVVKGRDISAQCPYSDDGSLCFDICFLNDIAVANSNLIGEYAKLDGRVRRVMLAVKSWAKGRNVASAADGTLSSYSWMVLVIYYLQSIDFVPNLQDATLMERHGVIPDPTNDPSHGVNGLDTAFLHSDAILEARLWKRNGRVDKLPSAALLYGFFKFHADVFPSSVAAVSIRLGGGGRRDEALLQKTSFVRSAKLWRMCIEDPFETYFSHFPHDLGIHLKEKGQARIVTCLSEACAQMERAFRHPNDGLQIMSKLVLGDGMDGSSSEKKGHENQPKKKGKLAGKAKHEKQVNAHPPKKVGAGEQRSKTEKANAQGMMEDGDVNVKSGRKANEHQAKPQHEGAHQAGSRHEAQSTKGGGHRPKEQHEAPRAAPSKHHKQGNARQSHKRGAGESKVNSRQTEAQSKSDMNDGVVAALTDQLTSLNCDDAGDNGKNTATEHPNGIVNETTAQHAEASGRKRRKRPRGGKKHKKSSSADQKAQGDGNGRPVPQINKELPTARNKKQSQNSRTGDKKTVSPENEVGGNAALPETQTSNASDAAARTQEKGKSGGKRRKPRPPPWVRRARKEEQQHVEVSKS